MDRDRNQIILVSCQGRFWRLAAHLQPILRRIGLAKMLELVLLVLRFLLTRFDTISPTSGLPTSKIVPDSPLALIASAIRPSMATPRVCTRQGFRG